MQLLSPEEPGPEGKEGKRSVARMGTLARGMSSNRSDAGSFGAVRLLPVGAVFHMRSSAEALV